MPIYEPELTYEQMTQKAETHICAEVGCGGLLTVAHSGAKDCYMLRCGNSLEHSKIKRPHYISYQDCIGIPTIKTSRRRLNELVEQIGVEKARALQQYHGAVLTQPEAMFILKTIWPKAPDVEVLKAAMICHQYKLNPLMKHVFLIPFKNKETGVDDWAAVLGIKASRLMASRRGTYSYIDDTPRIMTREDQMKMLGEVDDKKIFAITKLQRPDGTTVMGIGNWPVEKTPYGVEKGNTKLNMAIIRSERIALDRLQPGEMPENIEVMEERYADVKIESEGPPPGKTIVVETKKVEPEQPDCGIDKAWLNESLVKLRWTEPTVISWLKYTFKLPNAAGTLYEVLSRLNEEQKQIFVKEINDRLLML